MSEDRQDRRTLRTQEMLIHAWLEIIQHKHYDQITVKDIVEQANVGRSTFYAHYQNKDELLISGFDDSRSIIGITQMAVRQKMPYTPEQMDENFQMLMMPGIRYAPANNREWHQP
jgi:AcrR family transcriptional regulator